MKTLTIAFLSIFVIFLFSNNAYAQTMAPINYDVEITLIDIGEINTKQGSYDLKFLLTLSSNDVDFTEMEKLPVIDFVNGDLDKDIVIETLAPHSYSFEVDGTFFNDMSFHNYPFSPIDLLIKIESEEYTADQVQFTSNQLDNLSTKYGDHVPGWILVGVDDSIQDVKDANHKIHSHYVASYHMERPFLSNFFTKLFPIFIMVSIVIFAFIQNPKQHKMAEIGIGMFLSLVFLHAAFLSTDLPPLDYLTMQDKILIVSYITILYALSEEIIQQRYNKEDNAELKLKINRKMLKFLPIVMIGSALALLPL